MSAESTQLQQVQMTPLVKSFEDWVQNRHRPRASEAKKIGGLSEVPHQQPSLPPMVIALVAFGMEKGLLNLPARPKGMHPGNGAATSTTLFLRDQPDP